MVITMNPKTTHLAHEMMPDVEKSAFVHPQAFVSGDVFIGKDVFVAPFASIRADEGSPFYIGNGSNVQDGVVLHALETFGHDGRPIDAHLINVAGKKYAIYIGERVSLAHQSQIHGPAIVSDDTFIGMQAFVFKSRVGKGCVIEPCAKIIGVEIADSRYVPAGRVVNSQTEANTLPLITDDYPLAHLNEDVVKVNRELARTYRPREQG